MRFRLNPLTKFITVVVYCILLFLIEDLFTIALLWVIPFVLYLKNFKMSKFILFFSAFIFLVNVFFIPGNFFYKIEYALKIVLRFLGIIFSGMLFSREDPNEFAHALMRAGLPYRYGMTMVLTFRLIPLFSSESMTVGKAQMARGVDLEGVSSVLNLRYMFFPWIYSALERADALTLSMEGRCFGMHKKRTFVKESHFSCCDYVWLVILCAILGWSLWY